MDYKIANYNNQATLATTSAVVAVDAGEGIAIQKYTMYSGYQSICASNDMKHVEVEEQAVTQMRQKRETEYRNGSNQTFSKIEFDVSSFAFSLWRQQQQKAKALTNTLGK